MQDVLIREATPLDLDALYRCEQGIIGAGNAAAVRAYEKTGFVQHIVEMRMGLEE